MSIYFYVEICEQIGKQERVHKVMYTVYFEDSALRCIRTTQLVIL